MRWNPPLTEGGHHPYHPHTQQWWSSPGSSHLIQKPSSEVTNTDSGISFIKSVYNLCYIETYKLWKNKCCRKHRSLPPRSNPAFCSWSWTSSSSFWVPGVLFSAFFWYSPLFSFVTLILIRSFDVDAADEDDDGTGEDDDEEEETDGFVGSLLDEV